MKTSLTILSLLVGTSLTAVQAQNQWPQANPKPDISQSVDDMRQRVTKGINVMKGQPTADADMQKVLSSLASLKGKPIATLTPAEARQQPTPADAVAKLMQSEGKDSKDKMGVTTENIMIPGPGGNIPARIYKPQGTTTQGALANEGTRNNAALPIVVYYHGGGWVIADLDTYDASPRAIAQRTNAIVISSHYRQAPEHKFPAAHEDAFAAYQWALKNAASLGGDPKRVAVMGESAGGNLAINVSIMARDQKVMMPLHQVLVYPVAGTDMNTASYNTNANAKPLNKAMMNWFMGHVTVSAADKQDPRLNVVGKANLVDLPATTIITAEIDPLRSEGQALGQKLEAAGVTVNLKDYEGATHEFFGMAAVVKDAKDAQAVVASDLKSAFNTNMSLNR